MEPRGVCLRRKRITVIVNGKTVNECYDAFPATGRILPQTEGFEILFRKIELHPLKPIGPSGPQLPSEPKGP